MRTGEADTLFAFGAVAGRCFGHMVLRNGQVIGYDNRRERRYRFRRRQLEFLDDQGSVTSVLQQVKDRSLLMYCGRSIDNGVSLYLWGRLTLDQTPGVDAAPVVVNTLPKSGTYWLREAFVRMGYRPTDLHLNTRSFDDNRGLGGDPKIHWDPIARRTDIDVGALGVLLPRGTVSVGHIHDPVALSRLRARGVAVLNVSRDEAGFLESAFWFDWSIEKQRPTGLPWMSQPSTPAQFVAWLGDGDHLNRHRQWRQIMQESSDPPLLDYADLSSLSTTPALLDQVDEELRVPGAGLRLARALQETRGARTSTLSSGPRDPEVTRMVQKIVAEQ